MRALFSKYGLVVLSVLLLNSAYAEVANYTSGVAQPASSEEENYYKVVKGVMTYKGYEMPHDLDKATFEPLVFPFSKDKNRLYCGYRIYDVPTDNPANVKAFENHFAVDDSHIYFCEYDRGFIPYKKNYELTECFGWVKADGKWFYRLDARPEVKGNIQCLDNWIFAVIGKKLYTYGKEVKLAPNTRINLEKLVSLGKAGNGHYFTDKKQIIYESAGQAINVPLAYSAAIRIEDDGNIVTDGHKRYYCEQYPGGYASEPKPVCELKQ